MDNGQVVRNNFPLWEVVVLDQEDKDKALDLLVVHKLREAVRNNFRVEVAALVGIGQVQARDNFQAEVVVPVDQSTDWVDIVR